MFEIVKKSAEWNFSDLEISIFLNLRKIHSAEFFYNFACFFCVLKKKDLYKKNMRSPT